MKVRVCGVEHRPCTCWCHSTETEGQCGCWRVRTAEVAAVVKREADLAKDRGRDGRPLPEATLEAYLFRKIKALGGNVVRLTPTVRGVPDRLVMMPFGRMYFVEMKTHVGQPRPGQVVWHQRARNMGHVVHVINTKLKIDNFVRWAVATGPGLKDGHRQAAKDWEAMKRSYPYREHDEDGDE